MEATDGQPVGVRLSAGVAGLLARRQPAPRLRHQVRQPRLAPRPPHRRRPARGLQVQVQPLLPLPPPREGSPGSSGIEKLAPRGCDQSSVCPPMCSCTETTIDCRDRGLTAVPPNLPPATTELRLEQNKITYIPPRAFAGLHRLRRLDLSNNAIAELAPAAFSGLAALTSLVLYGNALTHIPPTAFQGLRTLQLLYTLSYPPSHQAQLAHMPRFQPLECEQAGMPPEGDVRGPREPQPPLPLRQPDQGHRQRDLRRAGPAPDAPPRPEPPHLRLQPRLARSLAPGPPRGDLGRPLRRAASPGPQETHPRSPLQVSLPRYALYFFLATSVLDGGCLEARRSL